MKTMSAIWLVIGLQFSAVAAAAGDKECDTRMLAGRWVFATGIGHQALEVPFPPADVTAIGTMNIGRDGEVAGRFGVTFEGATFVDDIGYSGAVDVNADCTGTLLFETEIGTSRPDSIVVLNRHEFWGMSQDPNNLWTYKARRLPGRRTGD